MLRGIISALTTIILVIIACVVFSWGLDYYRIHSTEHTVTTVCNITDDHAYTSDGILDANDSTLHALQSGRTYSIYTQKMWPWEFPTIMSASQLNVSASNACGPNSGPDSDSVHDSGPGSNYDD
jgi:hypothetical protein